MGLKLGKDPQTSRNRLVSIGCSVAHKQRPREIIDDVLKIADISRAPVNACSHHPSAPSRRLGCGFALNPCILDWRRV
jgi:hypothetical protein